VTSIRRIRSSGQKLDAMSREIELREERIKELKDGRAKLVHRSKVHKVLIFFVLPTSFLRISIYSATQCHCVRTS
jgi:hypothetical protein